MIGNIPAWPQGKKKFFIFLLKLILRVCASLSATLKTEVINVLEYVIHVLMRVFLLFSVPFILHSKRLYFSLDINVLIQGNPAFYCFSQEIMCKLQ